MKIQTLILLITIGFLTLKTDAQLPDALLAGEYDLEGVMEVGSGILLKQDHTFQIFLPTVHLTNQVAEHGR